MGACKFFAYVFLGVNFLSLSFGGIVLGVVTEEMKASTYVSVGVGAVVLFIAVWACWNTNTKGFTHTIMTIYFVFLLLLIVLNVTLAVLIFVKQSLIHEFALNILKHLYKHERNTFTYIGRKLECCNMLTCNMSMLGLGYKACAKKIQYLVQKYSMSLGGALFVASLIEMGMASRVNKIRRNLD